MHARHAPIWIGALALVVGLLLAMDGRSHAEQDGEPHIVFLHVTGEGATAKAWYKGAPPTGLPVQDALDQFSKQGYRLGSVSASSRPSITTVEGIGAPSLRDADVAEQYFVVFLERR